MPNRTDLETYKRAAEDARKHAERIASPWLRESYLRVAQDWEKLIKDMEELVKREEEEK